MLHNFPQCTASELDNLQQCTAAELDNFLKCTAAELDNFPQCTAAELLQSSWWHHTTATAQFLIKYFLFIILL